VRKILAVFLFISMVKFIGYPSEIRNHLIQGDEYFFEGNIKNLR